MVKFEHAIVFEGTKNAQESIGKNGTIICYPIIYNFLFKIVVARSNQVFVKQCSLFILLHIVGFAVNGSRKSFIWFGRGILGRYDQQAILLCIILVALITVSSSKFCDIIKRCSLLILLHIGVLAVTEYKNIFILTSWIWFWRWHSLADFLASYLGWWDDVDVGFGPHLLSCASNNGSHHFTNPNIVHGLLPTPCKKYKTETYRKMQADGQCEFGKRCHYVHSEQKKESPLPQGTEDGWSVPTPLLNHGVIWKMRVQWGFFMGAYFHSFADQCHSHHLMQPL